MAELGYLQHGRDWTITRDAIIRLTARLGTEFTYGDLAAEIEENDGLKIDGRGYAGALEAVASHLGGSEPPWTAMIVNDETREPGLGLWLANPNDPRYANAGRLSPDNRAVWLQEQRAWCIAAARVQRDPLNTALRDAETATRERAHDCLIDLLLVDRREP
jgi:hypothetical protein